MPVGPAIIIAPPPRQREAGALVQHDRAIAVAHFEMGSAYIVLARALEELLEEEAADAAALLAGEGVAR